jgi:small subunit ribosomal protein S17
MAETASSEKRTNLRKVRTGLVVSNKMDKTVVVAVERRYQHPLYKKYVVRTKRYYAHDAEKSCGVGDVVRIAETRPLSKTKRWRVASIVRKAQ